MSFCVSLLENIFTKHKLIVFAIANVVMLQIITL